jgi:hypothetical protein
MPEGVDYEHVFGEQKEYDKLNVSAARASRMVSGIAGPVSNEVDAGGRTGHSTAAIVPWKNSIKDSGS